MTTPAEKENRAAKRGCLWLLIGTPSLLLIYLILLSTSLFDSKPRSYPDLEIKPEGKTIPLLEALESSPDWADWKASEVSRDLVFEEIRPAWSLEKEIEPELAAKARAENERGIRVLRYLLNQDASFVAPTLEEMENGSLISFNTCRSVFQCLPDAYRLGGNSPGMTSADSLRLLVKLKPTGDSIIGRLVWQTNEQISHSLCTADIQRHFLHADAAALRSILSALDSTRASENRDITAALGGEFLFFSHYLGVYRGKLGDLGYNAMPFGSSGLLEKLLFQWSILRTQPNRSREMLAEIIRSYLAQSALPTKDRIYPTAASTDWANWISPAPNAGGKFFVKAALDTLKATLEKEDHARARHHLLRLLIGLALYRIDHGNELPADLAALVPAYIPELPKDPYTGEPPLYDPAAGKLAFRGMDFAPSSAPVDAEKEEKSRQRGLPPGVAGLFEKDGPHDPGVDLKAFFGAVEQPKP
jgi:hypothetical protein